MPKLTAITAITLSIAEPPIHALFEEVLAELEAGLEVIAESDETRVLDGIEALLKIAHIADAYSS
jgi:hypothetical protein